MSMFKTGQIYSSDHLFYFFVTKVNRRSIICDIFTRSYTGKYNLLKSKVCLPLENYVFDFASSLITSQILVYGSMRVSSSHIRKIQLEEKIGGARRDKKNKCASAMV